MADVVNQQTVSEEARPKVLLRHGMKVVVWVVPRERGGSVEGVAQLMHRSKRGKKIVQVGAWELWRVIFTDGPKKPYTRWVNPADVENP